MKSHPSKVPSQDTPSSVAPDLLTMLETTATPTQPELSGRKSAGRDAAWNARLERRREFNKFDDTIAQKIAGLKSQDPKLQPYEVVMFYLRERTKAEEQIRILDQVEMQKMAGYELKDFPPISDRAIPKIPLRMMVSTTLAIYPHATIDGGTPEEIGERAAKAAWNVINSSWKLLDSVERHRQTLQMWADQDRTRLNYFRQERTVSWRDGYMDVTTYNSTDSPWRFKEFLSAYYGQVLWHEKNVVFSSVQHCESAVAVDCGQWVASMDDFFRNQNFTHEEVDFFRKTLAHYVKLGILPEKGSKDENTTTRPQNRTSKTKTKTSKQPAKTNR